MPQLAQTDSTLDFTVLGAFFFIHPSTQELTMTIVSTITAGFMPRDAFHRPSRLWPRPRQKPYLEVPRDHRS